MSGAIALIIYISIMVYFSIQAYKANNTPLLILLLFFLIPAIIMFVLFTWPGKEK